MIKWLTVVLPLVLCNSLNATASSDLTHFFNNLGYASNVTGASSYESQAAGFASLGSVYARNQVRSIQLAHVDVPGFRSGCGGIDIFAGGASFIKADQIVKFMQSVLSSGAGYALNLALEIELPEIAHSMQYMQKLANDINSTNFNSCEMGENLAAAVWPKNRAAHQKLCEDIGSHTGMFHDWAEARQKCSTGGEMEKHLEAAKTNPEYKDRVLLNTNVVWDSLQLNEFIKNDTNLSEVYMSISGTLVFDAKGSVQIYPSLATNQDFVKALLYGGQLPSYKCTDGGIPIKCVGINVAGHQTIDSKDALVFQVKTLLQGIYDNIKSGTALSLEQKGLIELTQPSVFQLISASAQQNIGIQSSYELAQSVATDLLAQYLANSLEVIRASLAGKDLGSINEEKLFKNLASAQRFVDHFNSDTRARFNAALTTNQLVQNNVKQALNALNPLLRQAYTGGAQ
ncbi:conjugal transfer protein TraH [Legionella drozanskii]|uniref:Putative conjugative transfer protein TraH n=1 Tax=Legionella drozanskii LLAP-1 TaxID=1212489 RepID=A0A0W0SW88_9GAMM|nr:conjugal transfer protein TraH [Legionella drozanskii]KTC87647.1 putative conjugative transfer protein TraH [Legionella drozanskii LLAP-1]